MQCLGGYTKHSVIYGNATEALCGMNNSKDRGCPDVIPFECDAAATMQSGIWMLCALSRPQCPC